MPVLIRGGLHDAISRPGGADSRLGMVPPEPALIRGPADTVPARLAPDLEQAAALARHEKVAATRRAYQRFCDFDCAGVPIAS